MAMLGRLREPSPRLIARTAGKSQIQSIQALRALAALAVVAYHVPVVWSDPSRPAPYTIWANGSAGVDLFFVISGFIMVLSSRRLVGAPRGWQQFIWLRLVRVVPLYWLATALKIGAISAVPSMNGHTDVSPWRIVASFLFIPSRGSGIEVLPILAVGWTLSFEMLFYFVFAVGLFSLSEPLLIVAPAMTLLAVASGGRDVTSPAITALADPLVLEFVFGVLIARAYSHGTLQRIPKPAVVLLGLAGILCLILIPTHTSWERVAVWGVAASATLGAAVASRPWLDRHVPSWLVTIGEASYSLYLTHGFVLPVCVAVITRLGLRAELATGIVLVVSLVATTIVAVLVYRFVELPLTSVLQQAVRRRRTDTSEVVV